MSVRRYELELTAAGPVHIGNGNAYGKKDYFRSGKKIAVLDVRKFAAGLSGAQMSSYCEFLEKSTRQDSNANLQSFLEGDAAFMKLAEKSVAYRIDSPLATARRGSVLYYDVFEFVKDAYGNPYVPGSSVKGMLRTALLNALLLDDPDGYKPLFDGETARRSRSAGCDRAIVRKALWKERPDALDPSIVHDIMRYVSVSDSAPLSTDDLVFVKKYDKFSVDDDASHKLSMGKISDDAYYEGNELNIYRECLRPNTRFSVSLDIDDRIDAYLSPLVLDADGLRMILKRSYDFYSEVFLSHFDAGEQGSSETDGADEICRYVIAAGPLAGTRCRNRAVDGTGYCNTHKDKAGAAGPVESSTCYLGGGVDFISKTVVSALFDDHSERLSEVARILYGQFPTRIDSSLKPDLADAVRREGFEPRYMRASYKKSGQLNKAKDDHRHWLDEELGVSPHTLKMGVLGDKKYPMGKCALEIKERQ